MKKLISVLLVLVLWAAVLPAGAEEAAEASGSAPCYCKAWLCGSPYGYGADTAVLVMTNDPGRRAMTPEQVAEEIRFFPFDEAAGLYAAGDGEPAGDRAQITALSDSRTQYTVHLNAPGKYLLSGAWYYLLDRNVPALRGLRAELDGIVTGSKNAKDAKTAKALHSWLCGRVSPDLPEESAALLSAACTDPMNALLTGYARGDAWALLNALLLNAADIRCLTVAGTAGEQEGTWNLYKEDGAWRWTDAAADAAGGKKGAGHLGMDDKALAKDHTLCAADAAFTADMIRLPAIDALVCGTLDASQLKVYSDKLWDRNFDALVSEGPAWVVGESATVTFRLVTNQPEKYRKLTPEQFLEKYMSYSPWMEESHYYYSHANAATEEMVRHPEIPPVSELVTVEAAAEDLSTFTLTFHAPGRYLFFEYFSYSFYLISPDQKEPARIAADMDAAVAKAKKAATEKQAAQLLYKWILSKVKYNYTAYHWFTSNPTDRDMQTSGEPIGALLYGKCTCGGYSLIYSILLQQAGILQFPVSGVILPDYEGHMWSVNRLDGVWSFTDVTWSRFDWTAEKMAKDRECLQWQVMDRVFLSNSFDLLAAEMSEDRKPLDVLPLSLNYLPLKAEDYGFPEIREKDLIRAEVEPLSKRSIRITLSKAARVSISRWDEGKGASASGRKESDRAVKEFVAQFSPETPMIIEVLTYDSIPKMSRPALCTILYYKDGERVGTGARHMIPVKKNEYPGFNEYSCRWYEYDGQMQPYAVGWHLGSDDWYPCDLQVFFGADGKAERYAVSCGKLSWEGTPEQPLTQLQSKRGIDPAAADPLKWEPVWFE